MPQDHAGRRVGFSGVSIGTTTSCPGVSSASAAISRERAAVDIRRARRGGGRAFSELARHERDAAGRVHVGGHEAAARLDVATTGVRAAIASKSSSVERDPELAGDREQVQDAVRRAAAGRDRRDGVVERLAREDLRRPQVVPHELHREHARLVGGRPPSTGASAGIPFRPAGRDAEEVECHGHGVRGELAAARAGARAGDALERVHLGAAHRAGGVRADRLEDVLDRDVARP